MSPPPKSDLRLAIDHATWERGEIQRFQNTWTPLQTSDQSMLTFSWSELERQLADLAPRDAATASTLVSAIRKQARFKPPEMVLREVLIAASVLLDEDFQPDWRDGDAEEGQMT